MDRPAQKNVLKDLCPTVDQCTIHTMDGALTHVTKVRTRGNTEVGRYIGGWANQPVAGDRACPCFCSPSWATVISYMALGMEWIIGVGLRVCTYVLHTLTVVWCLCVDVQMDISICSAYIL